MYIITGRPREFYDPVWGQRLEGYFKGVVCHGDFENTPRNPEPDIILKAIEKFGLDPEYYIGNEENDILAAHGAGLKSIIVAPLDGDRDRFLASDVIIKSIDDLKDLLIL
jgi:phosphoglycolate phosphatase-like HAD superfamily hydrolase